MQIDAILSAATLTATAVGGFVGGRRTGKGDALGLAVGTVDLLQAQVETLSDYRIEKDQVIHGLEQRVQVLESLVTQRAEVDAVSVDVRGVKEVVDRIADKVGA